MESWLQIVLTSVASVIASSGFWAYMQNRSDNRDATTRLLMGLAYDQLTTRGVAYIERGWITKDEYEEYRKYFYEPYKALGGNGVAERIMQEVSTLSFRSHGKYEDIFRNENPGWINNVPVVSRPRQEASAE